MILLIDCWSSFSLLVVFLNISSDPVARIISRKQSHKEETTTTFKSGGNLIGSDMMMTFLNSDAACRVTANEIIKLLQTDSKLGLNETEIVTRKKYYGHNDFEVDDEEPMWKKYLGQFKEPMILLLLASAVISLLMRQYDDALSITIAIIIVVTVAFIQENRAEKEIEALKRLVPPKCVCIRDGRSQHIFARDLVPGDLCILDIGDRVPADLRLTESNDISIDESSFTGETKPSMKTIEPMSFGQRQTSISDRRNVAFMGTHVLNGNAKVNRSTVMCKNRTFSFHRVLWFVRVRIPNLEKSSKWCSSKR